VAGCKGLILDVIFSALPVEAPVETADGRLLHGLPLGSKEEEEEEAPREGTVGG
jgi:hypothetical protein